MTDTPNAVVCQVTPICTIQSYSQFIFKKCYFIVECWGMAIRHCFLSNTIRLCFWCVLNCWHFSKFGHMSLGSSPSVKTPSLRLHPRSPKLEPSTQVILRSTVILSVLLRIRRSLSEAFHFQPSHPWIGPGAAPGAAYTRLRSTRDITVQLC